jgi:hypothetical protein
VRFERITREWSVLGARKLRESLKGKLLTFFFSSFLKFLLIYGTWIYYFEICAIWVCILCIN